MAYSDAHKVLFGTHMLAKEVEYWWDNAHQRLEVVGTETTWENFKTVFLEKYFYTDVCIKKEIEFLELKPGNMIVDDYAVKFEELSRFCLHYNGIRVMGSKCIKFESDLHPEIKQFTRYQESRLFSLLLNKCSIYDEDNRARYAHYKSIIEKKSGSLKYGKPDGAPADKGKLKASCGKETSGGGSFVPLKCFKCGKIGVTYSLISLDCTKNLNLEVSHMDFGINLVCLPLSQLNVILGINWLEFNHIHINCFDKSFMFREFEEGENMMFISAKQVKESLEDDARVFMMFASLKAESKVVIGDLPVVCDFPEVFPNDISDFPPEYEFEFVIDLVHGTSYVLVAPYIMFTSEPSELKKQLEDLLEKKFV
ncbi:uncharacterized protein LOC127136015 [Lathyrus oleraceus]|uniref:uncharacterized protein LOC127136015 n=1 Tax=Pisum sativum TaxID=3888 RepID=UPI0021CEAAC1|nr:uncharacterized protein LOC127136015 [Pisum sativum]